MLHAALLSACQLEGDGARAAEISRRMQRRGLVTEIMPHATAVCDATGELREHGNGREPPPGASAATARRTLKLAAAAEKLWARVEARSAYTTQYHALPFDFVQRSTRAQQASSLRLHAEKKMLADLLISGADELSLTINIKVCADCHAFLKSASLLLNRTIRVREPGLVHTFTAGACSCADEWRWEERARRAKT